MTALASLLLVLSAGLLLYVTRQWIRGRALARRFAEAGTLSGKTRTEVIAFAGPPNSVADLPEGRTMVQWLGVGFHIGVVFHGDICERVALETRIFPR